MSIMMKPNLVAGALGYTASLYLSSMNGATLIQHVEGHRLNLNRAKISEELEETRKKSEDELRAKLDNGEFLNEIEETREKSEKELRAKEQRLNGEMIVAQKKAQKARQKLNKLMEIKLGDLEEKIDASRSLDLDEEEITKEYLEVKAEVEKRGCEERLWFDIDQIVNDLNSENVNNQIWVADAWYMLGIKLKEQDLFHRGVEARKKKVQKHLNIHFWFAFKNAYHYASTKVWPTDMNRAKRIISNIMLELGRFAKIIESTSTNSNLKTSHPEQVFSTYPNEGNDHVTEAYGSPPVLKDWQFFAEAITFDETNKASWQKLNDTCSWPCALCNGGANIREHQNTSKKIGWTKRDIFKEAYGADSSSYGSAVFEPAKRKFENIYEGYLNGDPSITFEEVDKYEKEFTKKEEIYRTKTNPEDTENITITTPTDIKKSLDDKTKSIRNKELNAKATLGDKRSESILKMKEAEHVESSSRARAIYQHAVSIDPTNPKAWYMLYDNTNGIEDVIGHVTVYDLKSKKTKNYVQGRASILYQAKRSLQRAEEKLRSMIDDFENGRNRISTTSNPNSVTAQTVVKAKEELIYVKKELFGEDVIDFNEERKQDLELANLFIKALEKNLYDLKTWKALNKVLSSYSVKKLYININGKKVEYTKRKIREVAYDQKLSEAISAYGYSFNLDPDESHFEWRKRNDRLDEIIRGQNHTYKKAIEEVPIKADGLQRQGSEDKVEK